MPTTALPSLAEARQDPRFEHKQLNAPTPAMERRAREWKAAQGSRRGALQSDTRQRLAAARARLRGKHLI